MEMKWIKFTSVTLLVFAIGCESSLPSGPDLPAPDPTATLDAQARPAPGTHTFTAPVFDIAATPNGGILVAEFTTVKHLRNGEADEVETIPTVAGSAVNGLAPIGKSSFFATSAGLDLAEGAGLWRVSRGESRLVGDITAFETQHDPDALEGPQWKDTRCEEDPDQGFTAGPQSNPYHLVALSGSETLIADAAGNSLLYAKTNGEVDWVAVFEPPVDENGDWRVLFTLPDETDCYVQPVPTSVAVGPQGDVFVGELTGAPSVPGWSRVWRIDSAAHNVVCPSADCHEVVSGLTSVIDVAFGPDGTFYVVELDAEGWLAAVLGGGSGGVIKRCDLATGDCTIVEDADAPLGAITFDKWGTMWAVENQGLFGGVATVRPVAL